MCIRDSRDTIGIIGYLGFGRIHENMVIFFIFHFAQTEQKKEKAFTQYIMSVCIRVLYTYMCPTYTNLTSNGKNLMLFTDNNVQ